MLVKITADQYGGQRGYEGAKLWLPANGFEIADALERARVSEGGGYSLHRFDDCPDFLRNALIVSGEKTLEEVNMLAKKISQMDEGQLDVYEGILKLHRENDPEQPMTIKDLINAAYNLDSFDFHPGVLDDQTLGELCIQGEMLGVAEKLPDEARELLDAEMIGEKLRQSDQGCFTSKGYVFRSSPDWKEVYDGIHLPGQPDGHKGLISLCLRSAIHISEGGSEVWLELPANKRTRMAALKALGESSFDSCVITKCESILPSLQCQFAGDEDIEKLNILAKRLAGFPDGKTLMKYKAVLELECYPGLDEMLDLAENLVCYDYDQDIVTATDYAEYLFKEAGIDTKDPAFAFFDFKGYGARQLEKSGFIATPYGAVNRNETPFRQEFTTFGQGMTMA